MTDAKSISQKVVSILKKSHGQDSAFMLYDPEFSSAIPYGIPSGSIQLDMAIGRPGLPIGRFVEIVGLESSGKSTIAQHILLETQKMGGVGIYAETESGLDVSRVRVLGLDETVLLPINPKDLESFFQMAVDAVTEIRKNGLPVEKPISIVLDSVAGLVPEAESEGDFGDAPMGIHARILSQALRKLMYFAPRMRALFVFVNQLRSTFKPYGEEYVSFGGKALKYRSTIRLNVVSLGKGKIVRDDEGNPISQTCKISVIKNKVNVPFKEVEVVINFAKGVDKISDAIAAGEACGLFKRSGAFYSYKNKKFMKKQFKDFLQKEFGGYRKFRRFIYNFLIDTGKMKPYGSDAVLKAWEKKHAG